MPESIGWAGPRPAGSIDRRATTAEPRGWAAREGGRLEDRRDLSTVDRRPSEGLRRDRMGGRAARRRAGGGGTRRHAVRDRRLADQGASRVRLRAGAGLGRDQRHHPGHDAHDVQPGGRGRTLRCPARPLAVLDARRRGRDRGADRPYPARIVRAGDDAAVLVRRPPRVVRRDQRGAAAVQRGSALRRRRLQRDRHERVSLAGGQGGLRAVPRARGAGEGVAARDRGRRRRGRAPRVRGQDRPPDRAGGVDEQRSSRSCPPTSRCWGRSPWRRR